MFYVPLCQSDVTLHTEPSIWKLEFFLLSWEHFKLKLNHIASTINHLSPAPAIPP